MVDITRCEKCGKVIPAIETGCAFCDAEEVSQGGFRENDWMPLSIRMLLWMFQLNLAGTAILAVVALAAAGGAAVKVLAGMRLAIAVTTLLAILVRHRWASGLPFVFLGFEGICFVGASGGLGGERGAVAKGPAGVRHIIEDERGIVGQNSSVAVDVAG